MSSPMHICLRLPLRLIQIIGILSLFALVVLVFYTTVKTKEHDDILLIIRNQRKAVTEDMITNKKRALSAMPGLTSPFPGGANPQVGRQSLSFPDDFTYVGCVLDAQLNSTMPSLNCSRLPDSNQIYTSTKINIMAGDLDYVFPPSFGLPEGKVYFSLEHWRVNYPVFVKKIFGEKIIKVMDHEIDNKNNILIPINVNVNHQNDFIQLISDRFNITSGYKIEQALVFLESSYSVLTNDVYSDFNKCTFIDFIKSMYNVTNDCPKYQMHIYKKIYIDLFKALAEEHCLNVNQTLCTECAKQLIQSQPVLCQDGTLGCLKNSTIDPVGMPHIHCEEDGSIDFSHKRIGVKAFMNLKKIAFDLNSFCITSEKRVMICDGETYLLNAEDESKTLTFDNYSPLNKFQVLNNTEACHYSSFKIELPLGNSSIVDYASDRSCIANNKFNYTIPTAAEDFQIIMDDGKFSDLSYPQIASYQKCLVKRRTLTDPADTQINVYMEPDNSIPSNGTCNYFKLAAMMKVRERIKST